VLVSSPEIASQRSGGEPTKSGVKFVAVLVQKSFEWGLGPYVAAAAARRQLARKRRH
jgi:hypothetical protein